MKFQGTNDGRDHRSRAPGEDAPRPTEEEWGHMRNSYTHVYIAGWVTGRLRVGRSWRVGRVARRYIARRKRKQLFIYSPPQAKNIFYT